MLWDKRLQAKQWLEKLKKTMSAPKGSKRAPSMRSAPDSSFSSSVPHTEGEGERERENSRPLLSDMKVMVLQGESLLSVEVAGAGAGEEGLAMAPASARSTVSSRELSKAQTVVEVAEEVHLKSCETTKEKENIIASLDLITSPSFLTQWLSRVREAMTFSAELHLNKQANRRKALQQRAGDEVDADADDDDASADALNELRELLKESDEMPVYMEEAVLLKCQLQALEWANKAALILPPTSSIDVSSASMSFEADTVHLAPSRETKGAGTGVGGAEAASGRQRARPRLAEVQRLAKEIKK